MVDWARLRSVAPLRGWLYRDAHYLVAEIEIDADAARRWVPWPLRVPREALASVFTAWFPHTTFGSVYREAGILLHLEHRGRPVVMSPWMIVDDDVALIAGRELLGYPKKLGEITFDLVGDDIAAVARRRGTSLIEMRGQLGERIAAPPPILGRPHRNVRTLLGVAFSHLVAFTPSERVIEVREAMLDVRIHGSERDPLTDLRFGRVRAARLHRVDLAAGGLPIPVAPVSPLFALQNLLLRSH